MNYIHKMKTMKMNRTSTSWKKKPNRISSLSDFKAVLHKAE
jgi:hypothetical protein